MAQVVDPFVPARQPKRKPSPQPKPMFQTPQPSASQLKPRVGNEFAASHTAQPARPKKPALDHLRSQYVPRPAKPDVLQMPKANQAPRHRVIPDPIGNPVIHGTSAQDVAAPITGSPVKLGMTQGGSPETQAINPVPRARHRDFTPPPKRQRRGMGVLKVVGAVVGGLAFGILVQSQAAGEALIGIYAVVAVLWRIESRVTFMMALGALVAIMAISLLKSGQPLANNFAVYAFLLLAVGTVSLAIETRRGY